MRVSLVFISLILLMLCAPCARAQEMTEIHHLDFGEFGLGDNTHPATIVIPPDDSGDATYSDGIVPGTRPARSGEYDLTGLPHNIILHTGVDMPIAPEGGVVVDNSSNLSKPGEPSFTVDHFTTNSPETDNSGEATLFIGATLTTSGNGSLYHDGDYDGTLDVTFFY